MPGHGIKLRSIREDDEVRKEMNRIFECLKPGLKRVKAKEYDT